MTYDVYSDPFPSPNELRNVSAFPSTATRVDGWYNASTGLGISTLDKSVNSAFIRDNRLSDQELADLYHFDDLCIKIVRLRPEEMFRVGYNIIVREPPKEGEVGKPEKLAAGKKPKFKPKTKPKKPLKKDAPEEDEKLEDDTEDTEEDNKGLELEKLGNALELNTKFLDAMCLGRAYGGALLFIGAMDGKSPEMPLDEENPGEIKFFTVFDRREMIVQDFYNDPLAPNYGMPRTYMLNPTYYTGPTGKTVAAGTIVHESRCIRFEGTHADRRERLKLWGWTYSVLQPVYSVVRDFQGLFRAMGYMVQDANQSVFKLSGLIDQISRNAEELRARMQFVENTRSVNRAVLLDVDEGEEFQKEQTSFGGVGDICDRFQQRLSAATGIPVTLLMGRSPAGLNATGDADLTSFYNSVARDQENLLKPLLLKVYKMLARSRGIDPHHVTVQCRPLVEMTEKERAELELAHAQKDKLYADSGVLTPEEIALSRFADPEEFGLRIQLDQASLDARRESLEMALEHPDFSGTNEAKGLGPDGKPLPAPPGGPVQPGSSGPGSKRNGGVPGGANSSAKGRPPRKPQQK